MPLLDDYSGPFDPDVSLGSFSRQALAHLGREFLLSGHLQDRVGLPLVAKLLGGQSYVDFSIEEWMGASPVYSLRMQRAMNFEGDDVSTVFKNLQFDIGAPHQFMDFQFRLDRPDYGEFWLPHCGALLDVEPFGEERVKLMCHNIEDPTFDATAAATHPCMKMRPIHRPPRNPADKAPHCRWSVSIGDDAEPFVQHPNLEIVKRSKVASVPVLIPDSDPEPGGKLDYSGPFDPAFQLEDLAHRALVIACQEFAVQSHLLTRAFMLCASQRQSDSVATDLGTAQWTGIAALTAERLARMLKLNSDSIDDVAKIFQLHPCFHPRSYIDFRVEITGANSARITMRDSAAFEEGDPYSWFAGLSCEPHRALDAIAGVINPRARCHPVKNPEGARLAWDIIIDPTSTPQEPPQELALAKISRGASFEFEQRGRVRA
jgi:hypothetical protein